jgi:hypothetical protein
VNGSNYWGSAENPIDLDAPAQPAIDLDAEGYYGHPDAIDLDKPLPYQPNPGAPNYNPNPGSTAEVAPQPGPQPAVLGAQPAGPPALSPTTNAFRTGAQLSSAVANAPTPPAPGPTPADDAAFAQFQAQRRAAPPPPYGAPSGGGGGAPANPFGGINKEILGTYDAQKRAQELAADADARKIALLGEHKAALARQQQADADTAKLEDDQAQRTFDQHMSQMQQQLDDVRAKKIDPNKYMNEHDAYGVMAVVGGLIGGIYQGLANLQKNPFLEDLQNRIDRQMGADEKNLANERAVVGDQMNLLAMNRAAYKDKRLADAATRQMYFESAKTQLEADSASADSDIAKARAQQGLAIIDQAQANLKKQFMQESARQAAAGAAAMYARQKEKQATYKEVYEKALGEGLTPAQAEYEAAKMVTTFYAPQEIGNLGPRPEAGAEAGLSARGRNEIAVKRHEAQTELNAQLGALKDIDVNAVTEGSRAGAYWTEKGLPDVGDARKAVGQRDAVNNQIRGAVDAAYRSQTGAAPTQFTIEHGADPYLITPRDEPQDAARKLRALEDYLVKGARGKGAVGTTPAEEDKALGVKPLGANPNTRKQ